MSGIKKLRASISAVVLTALLALPFGALAQTPTRVVAPKNPYSPDKDVQLGRQAAQQVERQMPLLNDSATQAYVANIGRRLAEAIPPEFQHPEFHYTYKVVNVRDVNAFALPGGFTYVNRGLIETAQNEAQLAGVIAHEISHVALRHGTAQAAKAQKYQVGSVLAQIAGVALGGGLGQVVGAGGQLGIGAAFLRYSRDYERQADTLGAQIMARAGYDPHELANMFRILEQLGTSKGPEWLSDHPNPGNRFEAINREADALHVPNAERDTPDFHRIQARLKDLPRARSTSEIGRNTQQTRYPQNGDPNYPDSRYPDSRRYPQDNGQNYPDSRRYPQDNDQNYPNSSRYPQDDQTYPNSSRYPQDTDQTYPNSRRRSRNTDQTGSSQYPGDPDSTDTGRSPRDTGSTSSRRYPGDTDTTASNRYPRDNGTGSANPPRNVSYPSSRYHTYDAGVVSIAVPDNWRELRTDDKEVTYAPEGGYNANNGDVTFTHGVQVEMAGPVSGDLRTATTQLIDTLKQNQSNLRVVGSYQSTTIGNRNGLTVTLRNVSEATGQPETATLVSTLTGKGELIYVVCVAPDTDYSNYQSVFQRIVRSLVVNE